jgi:protein O-GlcNAc transferase
MSSGDILASGASIPQDEAILFGHLSGRDRLHAAMLASLGERLHAKGRPESAYAAFRAASDLAPDNSQFMMATISVCLELGLPGKALDACNRLLERAEGDADALFATAVVLSRLGLFDPACHGYRRALAVAPTHVGALTNLPDCLLKLGKGDEALAAAEQATTRLTENAVLWFNLGEVLVTLERHGAALHAYERALSLDPSLRKAEVAIAVAHAALGGLAVAGRMFRHLQETDPEALRAFVSPLRTDVFAAYPELEPGRIALIAAYGRYRNCDWGARDDFVALYERVVRGEDCRPLENPDLPFLGIGLPLPGELRLRAAQQVAARIARGVAGLDPVRKRLRAPSDRLRVAYVSGDFRQHPTAYLVHRLFAEHDRKRFEVIAYSTGPQEACEYRDRIRAAADAFIDVSGYDDRTFAQRIARDRIDILVDLQGYTLYAKSAAFAMRPAPVQVAYLAYLATLGAPWIDYAILDRAVLPADERPWWSEKIAYLPATLYLCDDEARPVASASREELGLPADAVIYCSLNASWKITPEDFRCWLRILSAVPAAILWIYAETEACATALRAAAAREGVDPARLFFSGRVGHDAHLARFAAADVFLDTRQCNAHTTAIEALSAGLPVLTWPGDGVVSRVGLSLLRAHGVPELIAESGEEYEAIAIRLGNDADYRQSIRRRVADRSQSRLFATRRRVRELESAYETMWARHLAGLPPQDFDVPAVD